MRKLIFLFIILLGVGVKIWANEPVSFTASAPEVIVNGEQFKLTYTFNTSNVRDFRAPSIKDFEVLMGPNRSVSHMVVNGSASSSITFTYILLPTKEGSFILSGASAVAEGKATLSNSLKIKVLPSDQAGDGDMDNNTSGAKQPKTTSEGTGVSNHELFITATASKTNVHEQEAFLLTYKIYTLINPSALGLNGVKLPDFKGFHSQEITLSEKTNKFIPERYNGRNYYATIYRQFILFPQQTGKLEIDAARFDMVVAKAVQSADPFDAFFNGGGNYVEVKKAIITPKLTVNVSPLPAGKPISFLGGVGEFTLASSINTQELKTNDALTIKLTISGTGNIKLIKNPDIAFPKDFEVYDPKVDSKVNVTATGLTGTKTIEYLAIPRHAGEFKIPEVKFSYFDIKTKSYKTLKTEAYTVKVAKGAGNADQMIADFTNKEDLKVIGKDIRYIKTGESELTTKGDFFFGSTTYYLWYIIPFILFILFIIIYRKQAIDNSNISRVRTKKANKVATKRMNIAEKLLKNNKKAEFYDEVMRALWGYISDKLSIPVSKLSKDNVEDELARYGVNQELTQEFIHALNECEFARYAPGDENAAMDKVYSAAVDVISKMENSIKTNLIR